LTGSRLPYLGAGSRGRHIGRSTTPARGPTGRHDCLSVLLLYYNYYYSGFSYSYCWLLVLLVLVLVLLVLEPTRWPACLPACLSNCLPCCSVRWRLFEDDFVRGPVGDPSWGAAAKEGGGKEGRNEGGDSCQRLLPTLRPTNKGFRSSRSAFHALELRSFDFLPFVVNFLYGQGQDSAKFLIFLYQQKS
jgi:hypothetical protein